MTAKSVLQEMTAKYAAMQSYQDQGVVLTTWPDQATPNQIIFTTFFRRPNRFRFEWTSHHPYPPLRHLTTHCIIWSDGANAFSYTDQNGSIESEESLIMAIDGATGVSKGAALTVSKMLLPEIGAFSLIELQGLHLHEDEFEETRCYRICGYDSGLVPYEVLVGVDDHALRKISAAYPRCSIAEIRRQIHIDHPIPDDVFHFQAKV